MEFEWKPGFGLYNKYDAQKIGNELHSLPVIKPQTVVDYAGSHKDSELYKCFEWDNRKAADSWRKSQAGEILRSIVIKKTSYNSGSNEKTTIVIRAFENVHDEQNGSVYIDIQTALKDKDYRQQVLESIAEGIRELTQKGENYSHIIADYPKYSKGLGMAVKAISLKPTNTGRNK